MSRLVAAIVAAISLPAHAFHSMTPVPRIALKDFDAESSYQDRPLIIETGLDVEPLCDNLMERVAGQIITLQQTKRIYKKPKTTNTKNEYKPKSKKKQHRAAKQDKSKETVEKETKLYNLSMGQAIDLVMSQSNHDNSLFSFCEGLLDDLDTSEGVVDYSGKFALGKQNVDWFDLFPPHIQPSDCVILAGEGASSTLHRDPFEWTGTSLCLEGTKVWRFLEPHDSSAPDEAGVDSVDKLLKSYRLPSTAWEEGETFLSAGWQSDFNLYERRHESIPSARELGESGEEGHHQQLEEIAQNLSLLKPNFDSSKCSCWTVVQKPGDLLLIPAHWWHQTYALEPSLAVSSQRCVSKLDAARVIEHILSATDTMDEAPDALLQRDYSDLQAEKEIQEVIDALFDHLDSTLSVWDGEGGGER
ncbi:unnamed protein product [Cylindrotheca closterium]|uniref:JmjC domain-containing protein n=1 Tax=Cylindrotheca closterium TaxID=2856 RepID=A0AAD2GCT3_9STRA|nr:unnamed protein product [Cylindrotheca closterium]